VAFDVDEDRVNEVLRRLEAAASDVSNAVQLLWGAPTVMARFEDTGRVTAEVAFDLG
jgi:Ni,Fe-hydrogenase III large subunit